MHKSNERLLQISPALFWSKIYATDRPQSTFNYIQPVKSNSANCCRSITKIGHKTQCLLIRYRNTNLHANCDGLSRLPVEHSKEQTTDVTVNTTQIIETLPIQASDIRRETRDKIQFTAPGSRIHIDLARPFLQNDFFIVCDTGSKWGDVKILPDVTSHTIIEKLREIFAYFGIPEVVVSDNGTQFTSREFATFRN